MDGGENRCEDGRCSFDRDPGGDRVPKKEQRYYALCGPQVEPNAATWLRDGKKIAEDEVEEVRSEAPTSGGGGNWPELCLEAPQDCPTIRLPTRDEVLQFTSDFGDLDEVFPSEQDLADQMEQLLRLQELRDVPFGDLEPPLGPCTRKRPDGCEPEEDNSLPDNLVLTPTSRFLDLQPVPFGAVFNTAFPTTRPQFRVEDVADWRKRIGLDRVVVCTGRELARLFENETPGLYHRHALNWLLFNRPDLSPPRQARVWMALDMTIYTAMTAAWYFKWLDPRYRFLLRPSEYAKLENIANFEVLFDRMIARSGDGDYGRRTCPDFSPGTPRHPAWPSGHSTYSAAASYVLEFFFSPDTLDRTDEQVATEAAAVEERPGCWPTCDVWIANELRRLANNIGEARLWAGVHWADDHRAGQRIGRAAARAVICQFLGDCVPALKLDEMCETRRDECPPHPDDIQPEQPPCDVKQETVLQQMPDEKLRQSYGVI